MHEACWDSQSGTLKVKRNILNIMANDNRLSLEYNFQMTRVNPWLYMHCRERSSYQEERVVIQLSRGEGWDPINLFNPATLLYLSQARASISKVTCSGLFCVHWEGERWLFCVFFSQISFVCFVDIDGICEHHCLSSLS